jgi:hypothetical protein
VMRALASEVRFKSLGLNALLKRQIRLTQGSST